jgi:hypothetical protein
MHIVKSLSQSSHEATYLLKDHFPMLKYCGKSRMWESYFVVPFAWGSGQPATEFSIKLNQCWFQNICVCVYLYFGSSFYPLAKTNFVSQIFLGSFQLMNGKCLWTSVNFELMAWYTAVSADIIVFFPHSECKDLVVQHTCMHTYIALSCV